MDVWMKVLFGVGGEFRYLKSGISNRWRWEWIQWYQTIRKAI